jgi:hypothetical protein
MTTDNNFYEIIAKDDNGEPSGKVSVLRLRNGEVAIGVEEWETGEPDPNDSEVLESSIVLSAEEARALFRWGQNKVL